MNTMIAQIAAVVASVGFFGMMCFQILLALGFPLGQAAWGGKYIGKLPPRFRIASLFSAVIFVIASLFVLEKADVFSVFNSPNVVTAGVWVLAGFIALSALGNFVSQSKWEKRIMAPIALALSLLCITVAITSS
jgi:hypothetical protein